MIHTEDNGSFIFVTDTDQRIDVDLDMEDAPDGCCTISAGHAAARAHLTASEVCELIEKLQGVVKILRQQ